MKKNELKSINDISKPVEVLSEIDPSKFSKLPHPYEDWVDPPFKEMTDDQKSRIEHSLDGIMGLGFPTPESEEEKEKLVAKFLEGLRKLLSKEDNWTLLQPLILSMENCVKCQTCADRCPVYEATGGMEIYRPTFRAEVLRRIANKYIKGNGKLIAKFTGSDIDLNWDTVSRLAELSYRCTLCRRCAQACPIAVDNGLITREIRKLFSQELGIAAFEIHEGGSMKQLKTGSSTGVDPVAFKDTLEFIEEDLEDRIGKKIEMPLDKEGADILLMHNFGEFLSWPENVQAFAIIFDAAGLDWTLSSEMIAYDAVNYGLWYDDAQFARVALKHFGIAKGLGVKRVVVGECGHAHKAAMPISDRILTDDTLIPRESAMTVLEDIVVNEKIKLDPSRNDFPVTLHDPCNMVRAMGIVQPQRRILNKIAPKWREMHPHGVDNYCCGGGSGFAIMQSKNFPDWRNSISGRKKFAQILDAFQDVIDPSIDKYICAPCSNCKGQIRDMLSYYDAREKTGMIYGGLVELIVNAMVDIPEGFIEWDAFM
ncbi:(Fe-S)-binding protein [candidate division KSB1 bacterium]